MFWLTIEIFRSPCEIATLRDAHVAACHDGAGALVDHHLGAAVRLHRHVLDAGEEVTRSSRWPSGTLISMPEASARLRQPRAQLRVDRGGHAVGRGVVGLGQHERQVLLGASTCAVTPTSTVAPPGIEPTVGWFFCTTLPLASYR